MGYNWIDDFQKISTAKGIKMANRFTDKGENALNSALKIAEKFGHTYVGSEHILMALLSDSLSCSFAILAKCGVSKEKVENGIKEYSGSGTKSSLSAKDMTPRCRKIVEASYKYSVKYSSQKIGRVRFGIRIYPRPF